MNIIEEKIKDAHYYKFQGVAPEGFILVPIDVLEELKCFDLWTEWKKDPQILIEKIKNYCNTL